MPSPETVDCSTCAFRMPSSKCWYDIIPRVNCVNYLNENSCLLCEKAKDYFCLRTRKRVSAESLQCSEFKQIDIAYFRR